MICAQQLQPREREDRMRRVTRVVHRWTSLVIAHVVALIFVLLGLDRQRVHLI